MQHNALVGQARLFAHYLVSDAPAPIGLGMDRWFVFLRKGGVSGGTIAVLLLFPIGGVLTAGWMLRRELARKDVVLHHEP
jgi:hypothetical protein